MILLQPKTVVIDDIEFIISKFPAVAGREIMMMYPISGAGSLQTLLTGKAGDYKQNEAIMLKLMCFVGKQIQGKETPQMLSNSALIDNHVVSEFPFETLIKLEREVIEYNTSFFQGGRVSTFLEDIAQKGKALVFKMLTDSLAQSSRQEKPPSTN